MPLPRLYVGFDADLDWPTCLEFGLVDDGQPAERWRGLVPWLGFYEAADGRTAGFKVPSVGDVDLDDERVAEAWDGPASTCRSSAWTRCPPRTGAAAAARLDGLG